MGVDVFCFEASHFWGWFERETTRLLTILGADSKTTFNEVQVAER